MIAHIPSNVKGMPPLPRLRILLGPDGSAWRDAHGGVDAEMREHAAHDRGRAAACRFIVGDALLLAALPRGQVLAMPLPLPTFTTDDLRSFPEDGQRYELLEGVLLGTPAPGSGHQVVLGRLIGAVGRHVAMDGLAYAVSPGEIEVAPKTLLDPDLLVFPATYAPGTPWRTMSGWWLAAEVLSPSSRMYDRAYKRDAYLSLGVREVWLLDLDERAVFVSRRGEAERDVRHDRVLRWTPEELREPLAIDVASLFDGLL